MEAEKQIHSALGSLVSIKTLDICIEYGEKIETYAVAMTNFSESKIAKSFMTLQFNAIEDSGG
ncbi:CLUMA_CG015701, isoform A [Clunio marinus]|uniref:CLUMA_CG015701, isoform A n=1 Tax=Clunio marinus TaxID=568069 RepID=A0A1J1IR12_9DIPT|nr:CLUMA_CG015701, isoform A [Clunio marinus]